MTKKYLLFIGCLLLISGCSTSYNPAGWKDKQIDDLNSRIYNLIIETHNWYCVEWANTTEINPEWVDHCCVVSSMTLTDSNPQEDMDGKLDKENIGISISKEGNNTAISLTKICFEPINDGMANTTINELSVAGNSVNMTLCYSIPKMIETNQSECVTQKRKR